MTPDRLIVHFERLAEAPDAIPRLRRFILDLAVRGKLVPHDPNDEPASALLKKIQVEKTRLAKVHKIKQQDAIRPISKDELLFDMPHGWCPARLAEVTVCLDYLREPINTTEREQRIAGKAPSELFPYFGATQQQGWIDGYIFDEELVLLGEDGVPFFDDLRPKAYLISGKTWVNNHAHVFRGILASHTFLAHYLNTFNYSGRVAGATRSKLNQAKAVDIPIILPPLAEQHRIVAKVDELMGLCDRLEAAQAERESRRDRLVAASLQRLNHPAGEDRLEAFREPARFYLNHLPRLTARPEHIKQLRQTILNLAMRGKLVPQDPNDEPASELLKHIRAEKARLVKVGTIKPQKPVMPIDASETPSEVPANWKWVRLSDLLLRGSQNGYSKKPDDVLDGIPILRISAGTMRKDGIVAEEEHKLIGGVSAAQQEQYQLHPGDLLACRFNGNRSFVGRLSLYLGYLAINPIYPDKLIRLRLLSQFVLPKLVRYFAESIIVRKDIENYCATTVGNWGISASNLKNVRIPLPPLAEQHRIVAKVDELMAVCDQLEAQLTTTQTESRRLLEAVLHEALIPAAGAILV